MQTESETTKWRPIIQAAGVFADRSRKDRGIDQHEIVMVQEITNGLDDLIPYPRDGGLPAAAEPEVSMLEEIGGTRPASEALPGLCR